MAKNKTNISNEYWYENVMGLETFLSFDGTNYYLVEQSPNKDGWQLEIIPKEDSLGLDFPRMDKISKDKFKKKIHELRTLLLKAV